MKKHLAVAFALFLSYVGVAHSALASDWNGVWVDSDGTFFTTTERNGALVTVRLDYMLTTPEAIAGSEWGAGIGTISGTTATVTQYDSDCQSVMQLDFPTDTTLTGTVISATPTSWGTCEGLQAGASISWRRVL